MGTILKVLPLFIIFIAVYFLKRGNVLRKEYNDAVSKLIVWLVAPAIITKSLAQATITPNLLYLPLIATLGVLSLLAIGYALSHILNLKGKTRGSFIIAFPTLEGGTVGYTMMLAAFGELGLSRIVLWDFGNALIEFSLIYFFAVLLGKGASGKAAIAKSLIQMFKMPLVWAIPAGLLLNFANFKSPMFYGILDVAGAGLVFLVIAMLGLEFEPKIGLFKLPVLTMAFRTISSLAVAFGLVRLFGLTGMERAAVIIGTCLPTSIMALVFAKENDLDTEFVSNLLALGLPYSLVFLSVLMYFIS